MPYATELAGVLEDSCPVTVVVDIERNAIGLPVQ
jgi:hypothetical protein